MEKLEKVIEGLEKVWHGLHEMEHELYADYVFDALEVLVDLKEKNKNNYVIECQ